jgi:hypothetical protein
VRFKPIIALPLSLIVVGAVACKKDENNPDAPSFEVTVNPLTINAGGEFTVNFTVKNFELDPANYGGTAMPGKGHWHVYLDTEVDANKLKGSALPSETIVMPIATTAGPHNLLFILENNDHTPIAGVDPKTVNVTVNAALPPTLAAQVNPTTIPAGGIFTMTVQVTNWILDQENYGGMPIPGHGHYHVYIDQVGDAYKLKGSAQTPQMVTLPVETTAGPHTLIVTLEMNNHVHVDGVEVRLPITVEPAPPATLSVSLDNTTIEAGGYATATVNAQYFVLDEENFMGANMDRHGHWHAYLDQVGDQYYLTASALAMDRVTIPEATTDGPHELIFTLNNNDHSPYTPPTEYRVPITVRVIAPPPPNNVVVEGQTTKLGAYLAGDTQTVGDASLLVYGVYPNLTAIADPNGNYSLQVPANGNALVFSNKANYFPSYNTVATTDQNIVGKRLYMAETAWINAIAANHNVDLTAPFACQTPSLAGVQCIYTIIVGRVLDDGYDGQGQIRPVANLAQTDFAIRGPGADGAQWYKKGPYFLNYDGTPGQYATSVTYYDEPNQAYRGGLFVTFLEIPQLDGAPYIDFNMSISYTDAARGITRYFGPIDVKSFRPYGVSWVTINETGVPIQPPVENINFDTQIYPLFLPVAEGGLGCIGCHTNANGATPAAGMNLYGGPDVAFASLDPVAYPQRVNLVDIDASYVLKRPLYEADGVQDHPIFAFASPQDLGYLTIRKWIEEGAVRNVVVAPVSFYNEIRKGLYDTPQNGGWGCRACHYDGVNAQTAPANFFMSNVAAELFDNLVNQPATHSDYPDPLDPQHEPYRINKANYPERSLALIKPLAGNAALHPVKIFANNQDPRYLLLYRWITEGYVNDSPP